MQVHCVVISDRVFLPDPEPEHRQILMLTDSVDIHTIDLTAQRSQELYVKFNGSIINVNQATSINDLCKTIRKMDVE